MYPFVVGPSLKQTDDMNPSASCWRVFSLKKLFRMIVSTFADALAFRPLRKSPAKQRDQSPGVLASQAATMRTTPAQARPLDFDSLAVAKRASGIEK